MNEVLDVLKTLKEEFQMKKKESATREYNIYYAGAVDAISTAIKKLNS